MAVFSWLTSQLVLIGWNVFGLTTLASATMFANIVLGAALLGLYAGASALTSTATMRTAQAQAVLNQSAGARIRGYGRALLGGTRAFWDSKSGDLYQVTMMHSGEIDAIEAVRVGDITATLAGNGDATNNALSTTIDGTTRRHVRIRTHLGTATQTADAMMTDAWSGVWTSQHRLRGIANIAVRFRSPVQDRFQRIFPEGYNTPVRALCRLTKVWDPRTDTTAWSDNSGLCILDYLTHADGYRLSIDDVDIPSFAAFADVSDEDVPLAGGGTEKRYRLWGVHSLNDEPHAVLRKMLNTCDGELHQTPQGKIAIRGGKWEAPTVTVTADHNLGYSMEQGNNRFAAFNELKILYTSPAHGYQTMEATAWIDTADQAERGPIISDFDLDFVPSPSQARRLAKIHRAKANPRWRGSIRTDLSGLDALGERAIRGIVPELEIDEAFLIAGLELSPDLSAVELQCTSITSEAYAWDPATEEGQNPPPAQETAPSLDFPVPVPVSVTNPSSGVALLEVDDPGREDLELDAQIRAGAGENWMPMEAESQTEARGTDLAPGNYQLRARWLGPQGTAGDWFFPYEDLTIS